MRMLFRMRRALVAAASIAGLCALAPAAHAEFGVSKFDAGTCTMNTEPAPQCTRDSDPELLVLDRPAAIRSGASPTSRSTRPAPAPRTPDGNVKDVHVDLPVGLSINPEATPKCTTAQLEAQRVRPTALSGPTTSPRSLAGRGHGPDPHHRLQHGPARGHAGAVRHVGAARRRRDLPRRRRRLGLRLPRVLHDQQHHRRDSRWSRRAWSSTAAPATARSSPCQSTCTDSATTGLQVDSHQEPGKYLSYSTKTPIKASGCDKLPFSPTVGVAVDTRVAGAPSGVTIDVGLPRNPNGKDQPDTATLKDAHVTLPEGMTINPSAATGLGPAPTSSSARARRARSPARPRRRSAAWTSRRRCCRRAR